MWITSQLPTYYVPDRSEKYFRPTGVTEAAEEAPEEAPEERDKHRIQLWDFLASGLAPVDDGVFAHPTRPLPSVKWAWYRRETPIGQVRRRLIKLCRPRISAPIQNLPCRSNYLRPRNFHEFSRLISWELQSTNTL